MGANTKKTRARLRQIVALLVSLAGLAERAAGRSGPAAWFVVWLLRQAEAVAHGHVLGLTGRVACAPDDLSSDANEALHLAARFRALALALETLLVAMAGILGLAATPRAITLPAGAAAAPAPRPRPVGRRDSS